MAVVEDPEGLGVMGGEEFLIGGEVRVPNGCSLPCSDA
jgi:hypothetical protein